MASQAARQNIAGSRSLQVRKRTGMVKAREPNVSTYLKYTISHCNFNIFGISLLNYVNEKYPMQWRIQEEAPGTRPTWSKFFHFHTVFDKNFEVSANPGSVTAMVTERLQRHLLCIPVLLKKMTHSR